MAQMSYDVDSEALCLCSHKLDHSLIKPMAYSLDCIQDVIYRHTTSYSDISRSIHNHHIVGLMH